MRKLIVSMNVTLDGYMAGPDCELDWHFQCWSADMAQAASEELSRADTLLLGRVTYHAMARYWPAQSFNRSFAREDIAFADMMNSYAKIVCSKTLSILSWHNTRLLKTDIAAAIAHLKQQPGRDIMIYGSGKLVASLLPLGVIDEYQLWLHPVVLGKGKALFNALPHQLDMQLFRTKIFKSGVVMVCYQTKQFEHAMHLSSPSTRHCLT